MSSTTLSKTPSPRQLRDARLLKLNHERYAEEVQQGLHEKKGRGTRGEGREKAKEKKGNGRSLFDGEGEE